MQVSAWCSLWARGFFDDEDRRSGLESATHAGGDDGEIDPKRTEADERDLRLYLRLIGLAAAATIVAAKPSAGFTPSEICADRACSQAGQVHPRIGADRERSLGRRSPRL